MIRPLVAVQRGDAAEHDTKHQCDDHRDQTDFGGDREGFADRLRNVAAILQRDAEIAMQDVLHVIDELHMNRLVQTISCIQRRDDFRGLRLLSIERSARDRVHHEEGDEADQKHGDGCQQNAFYNVLCHLFLPLSKTCFDPAKASRAVSSGNQTLVRTSRTLLW